MKRMSNYTKISGFLATLFLIPWLVACETSGASGGGGEPYQVMELEITYVAGHLGTGSGCPSSGTNTSKADSASAQCFGEGCNGGPFSTSCDVGELTVQLRNLGEHTLTGLEITDLELLKEDLSFVKVLDVEAVNHTDGKAFNGTLKPGAIVQLRVDFYIPNHEWNLDRGRIHVFVADKTGQTTEITTPAIDRLHTIDT